MNGSSKAFRPAKEGIIATTRTGRWWGTRFMLESYFTCTETVGLLGMGAQDGHLDFHTAPELGGGGGGGGGGEGAGDAPMQISLSTLQLAL